MITTTKAIAEKLNRSAPAIRKAYENFGLKIKKISKTQIEIDDLDFSKFVDFVKKMKPANKTESPYRVKVLEELKKIGDKGMSAREIQTLLGIKTRLVVVENIFMFDDPICTDGRGKNKRYFYIDWSKR